tara:strand:- start:4009 stop:4197 length:189 start_codon:yes stop_codon:yes gene_type:complete
MSGFLASKPSDLNRWKRFLLNQSGLKGLTGADFAKLSQDERIAYSQLAQLNQDIALESKPKP